MSVAPLRNVWRFRFYLGVGISGNDGLAGPALPLSSQNSSAFQKHRGWNSPQGVFGPSLGNKECLWIQQHILKGMAAGQGQAPVVTHESQERPRAPGESQGWAWEGNTPWVPQPGHVLPFGFLPGLWFHPGFVCLSWVIFGEQGWSPKGEKFSRPLWGWDEAALPWMPFKVAPGILSTHCSILTYSTERTPSLSSESLKSQGMLSLGWKQPEMPGTSFIPWRWA